MKMIEVQDLTKKFNGKTVLNGINFQVNEGEIFGYLGPNGAGKTTTMRIVLGLLKPASGRALVFGKELGDNGELRRRVGVLLENDGLYERLSAYENLNYYAQLYSVSDIEERIKNLLDFVGLSDRQNDRVGVFSKGMKRRLALARSIIHDPDVLFYDEPSAGLDPEAQKMVRDLILRLAREKGRTIYLHCNLSNSGFFVEIFVFLPYALSLHLERYRRSLKYSNLFPWPFSIYFRVYIPLK